ncbi:HBL165Wp [Eremothecium sinecaudum]|uniref:HBL165Wp n=1 Tax=Eremothecium sinecaudum TaxID=45286 RepID=A0A120K0V8_9SACH|nr:HBL165Wp [Eremothecium sinecaudum]AMD18737.1 HBL165Wp [Eremothecium sinecaudum]
MITYKQLDLSSDVQFNTIKKLIDEDLSEPYSIYVYRYFLNQWPSLAYLAYDSSSPETSKEPIGCIVCKAESHRKVRKRGYIAMLAVSRSYRSQGIAKKLITLAISEMVKQQCDEIMLETECSNKVALHLYESIGFIRLKRMFRYYLNQGDAYKLILPITDRSCQRSTFLCANES